MSAEVPPGAGKKPKREAPRKAFAPTEAEKGRFDALRGPDAFKAGFAEFLAQRPDLASVPELEQVRAYHTDLADEEALLKQANTESASAGRAEQHRELARIQNILDYLDIFDHVGEDKVYKTKDKKGRERTLGVVTKGNPLLVFERRDPVMVESPLQGVVSFEDASPTKKAARERRKKADAPTDAELRTGGRMARTDALDGLPTNRREQPSRVEVKAETASKSLSAQERRAGFSMFGTAEATPQEREKALREGYLAALGIKSKRARANEMMHVVSDEVLASIRFAYNDGSLSRETFEKLGAAYAEAVKETYVTQKEGPVNFSQSKEVAETLGATAAELHGVMQGSFGDINALIGKLTGRTVKLPSNPRAALSELLAAEEHWMLKKPGFSVDAISFDTTAVSSDPKQQRLLDLMMLRVPNATWKALKPSPEKAEKWNFTAFETMLGRAYQKGVAAYNERFKNVPDSERPGSAAEWGAIRAAFEAYADFREMQESYKENASSTVEKDAAKLAAVKERLKPARKAESQKPEALVEHPPLPGFEDVDRFVQQEFTPLIERLARHEAPADKPALRRGAAKLIDIADEVREEGARSHKQRKHWESVFPDMMGYVYHRVAAEAVKGVPPSENGGADVTQSLIDDVDAMLSTNTRNRVKHGDRVNMVLDLIHRLPAHIDSSRKEAERKPGFWTRIIGSGGEIRTRKIRERWNRILKHPAGEAYIAELKRTAETLAKSA